VIDAPVESSAFACGCLMSTGAVNPVNPVDAAKTAKRASKRRWLLFILSLPFCSLLPFFFWQATWFGRPLDDAQLQTSLADSGQPRIYPAPASQIADRILSPDTGPSRFCAAALSGRDSRCANRRRRVAHHRGLAHGSGQFVADFQRELLVLLGDAIPWSGANAALALVRFHDAAGPG